MPPFEYDPKQLFEAIATLANERDQSWRFTKRGDKRPAYDVETAKVARRKKYDAKRKAVSEAALAEIRARQSTRRPPGRDIASRMLLAMEPGKFYGQGDLVRMIGEGRSARGKVHQTLMKRGWVEAGHNPAHSAAILNPWKIMAGAEPHPRNLYRLTEAGEARRTEIAERLKSG